jgi:Tol biopolymer transport system component
MNSDGSGQRRLTRSPIHETGPAWSPDGRHIAFQRGVTDDTEIYVVNVDGSGEQQLTRNDELDGEPTWSPDGKQIAYSSGSFFIRIYVMNADGSGG